jgi:hypothetical protein
LFVLLFLSLLLLLVLLLLFVLLLVVLSFLLMFLCLLLFLWLLLLLVFVWFLLLLLLLVLFLVLLWFLLYLCFVIGIGCVSVLVIVLDWGFPDMHCRRSPWLRRGPHTSQVSQAGAFSQGGVGVPFRRGRLRHGRLGHNG